MHFSCSAGCSFYGTVLQAAWRFEFVVLWGIDLCLFGRISPGFCQRCYCYSIHSRTLLMHRLGIVDCAFCCYFLYIFLLVCIIALITFILKLMPCCFMLTDMRPQHQDCFAKYKSWHSLFQECHANFVCLFGGEVIEVLF